MSGLPLISVVMPVHNGVACLARAIASLRQQTYRHWELLVVDDGSADGTASLLLDHAVREPRLRLYRHTSRAGIGTARNTALRRSRGTWIAYLDCEDEFYPDHLERVASGQFEGNALVFDYDIREERLGELDTGIEYAYQPRRWVRHLLEVKVAAPLAVMHTRELLEQTGLFDENLGRDEDQDLWCRFARAGVKFTFVAATCGRFHIRSERLTRALRTEDDHRSGPPLPPTVEVIHDPLGHSDHSLPLLNTAARRRARLLFCSYHGYMDPSSGAAWSMRDLLESFAGQGRGVGVLCGPHLDLAHSVPVAEALRLQGTAFRRDAVKRHGLELGLFHGNVNGVPVIVFDPVDRPPAAEPGEDEEGAFLKMLRQVQGQFRGDVLLTYGGHRLARGVMAEGRRLGMKVVFWLCNLAYTDPTFFQAADAVIVPSSFARDHYRGLGIECVALPGPVRPERVRCDRRDGRFLTFVSPTPFKGVSLACRIFRDLAIRRPDIPVLVVEGRGDVDWLAKAGLAGACALHRMPSTFDPRDFYRVTRVLLAPSLRAETFGRVCAEAILNGIPVIASDHDALRETIGTAGTVLPVSERLKKNPYLIATAEEARDWVEAVIRAWDGPTNALPAAEVAEVCSRWSGEAAMTRFGDFFDSIIYSRP